MKRLVVLLMATVMCIGLFTGCANKSNANVVIGRAYTWHFDTNNWEKISFFPDGTAQLYTVKKGEISLQTHLTYSINRSDVKVYFDYSEDIPERYRGEILAEFTCYAEGEYLMSNMGLKYVLNTTN